ncbi:Teichoic acid translocation permease TagG [Salipaludibacillus keqinensis]|uniref:Transport permease protein n=1 Tax=Salipaludibacillus keqinensis TaxID=2045207 RepID=A0A323TGB2_9BACI|nr:ABC transporter permease [Salipaludibacillus keqinensis]PYZ92597.1 Teichoic acid translocation permease TagG [Salipaludibacillus keqinensis]
MTHVFHLLKEQYANLGLIFRMSAYDVKSQYQMHYLGALWQFLTPAVQIFVYWFVFGIGIRGGAPVGEIPFFVWLLCGLIPWFFIGPSLVQGSNSIYTKINLVSKMKFPVSILPTITIISKSTNFYIMLVILTGIIYLSGINPGIYLLQLPYYLLCLYAFLFAFTILASTISIIIRDFQLFLQSMMRLLFFLTPILWEPSRMPEIYHQILKLNPFYYLIFGFRDTFLGQGWFYEDLTYMLYFWLLTLLILLVGAIMHFKFRKKFIDFL